jgi:spermidine synthase
VEIVDAYGVRSLHFGTPPRQSAMSLAEPDRLELPYVRAMLAVLLFTEPPRRVLLLGLGGGSLGKFLLRQYPSSLIDAVESREVVVSLARRFFGLPDDPRLTIHVVDGHDFLSRESGGRSGAYDHVFVDIFDHRGLAAALGDSDFFTALRGLLAADGAVAVNLWRTQPESLRRAMAMLAQVCEGGARRLDVMGRGNVIGLGLGPDLPARSRKDLEQRAGKLEAKLGVELTRLLPQISVVH